MKKQKKSYKEYLTDYLVCFTAALIIIAVFSIYFYNVFVKFQINYAKQHNQTIISKTYDFQNDLITVSNSFFGDKTVNSFLNDKNEFYSLEASVKINSFIKNSTINSILTDISVVITKDNLIYSTLTDKKSNIDEFCVDFPEFEEYIKNPSEGFKIYPLKYNSSSKFLLFSYDDYRGHIIFAIVNKTNLKNHLFNYIYPIPHNTILLDSDGNLFASTESREAYKIIEKTKKFNNDKESFSGNVIMIKTTAQQYSCISVIKLSDIWAEALSTGSFLMLLATMIFILFCIITYYFYFKQKKLISTHLSLLSSHIDASVNNSVRKLFNCEILTSNDETVLNECFQLNGEGVLIPIVVGIINYNDLIENSSYDDVSMFKYGFENIISEVLGEISKVKTTNMGKELIGILLYFEETPDINTIKTKIKYFENVIQKNFQAELFSVIGENTEDVISAYEQIPMLINAQNYKFINNENEVFISEISKEESQTEYPIHIQTEIIASINSKKFEIFSATIAKFSDYIIKNNSLNGKEWFVKLFLSISENCHKNPDISIAYNTLEAMLNCDKIGEMADMLSHSIKYHNIPAGEINPAIEEEFDHIVKKTIEEEFSNPDFCIQSITERFGFTASYFGKKFKHRFNISFNKYLLDYRIKHAVKLLSETNYTNTKIAEMCGFNSATYFMTVFKKNIGLTPKEFKDKQ